LTSRPRRLRIASAAALKAYTLWLSVLHCFIADPRSLPSAVDKENRATSTLAEGLFAQPERAGCFACD